MPQQGYVAYPDYSRIRDALIKENYLLGLGYLEGYVFFRVMAREVVPLVYDPTQESTSSNLVGIAAKTFINVQKFGSSNLSSTNIFQVDDAFHVYQAFFGISPSMTRVFINTDATNQKQLDEGDWSTNNDFRFGFIDGFMSPLNAPTPESEQFIPKNTQYQFGVYNPYKVPVSPLFNFIINRLQVAVIRDQALIGRILSGSVTAPARLTNVGGLNPPKYSLKGDWAVSPIPLDANAQEIAAAVAGG